MLTGRSFKFNVLKLVAFHKKYRRKQMKHIILKTIALAFLVFAANANAISFFPSDEEYIGINGLGSVNGPYSGGTMGPFVGKIDHIQSGDPSLNVESRGIYEFNIATLLGTTVSSASFSFRINDPAIGISSCFDLIGCPAITGLDIFGYVGNGTVELSDFWAVNLLDSISINDPIPALGSLVTIDVTSFISGLVNSGDLFAGFNLQAASFNGGLRIPDGLLTITTVPEPPTVFILGLGLIGLVGLSKSKRIV